MSAVSPIWFSKIISILFSIHKLVERNVVERGKRKLVERSWHNMVERNVAERSER